MDQLHCMRLFTRVVEQGSFVRAADHLNVSTASVTKGVAQLENRLGVRLLQRTTRRISLTDDGRAYYDRCVRILGDIHEAEEVLSRSRVSPRGRLRVTVPQALAHVLFFPLLPRFFERYPEIALEVVLTDRMVNLVEEGVDCAVRAIELPPDSTMVARRLSPSWRVCCASPGYLRKHGTPLTPDDLAQHNCISFVLPSTGRTMEWRFERDGEPREFLPHGNLGTTSMEAGVTAALAGLGVAQVPESLAHAAVVDGRLQPLLLDWVARGPSLHLVYPQNRHLSSKVRAFADFVLEVFPPEGWWKDIAARGSTARAGTKARAAKRPGRPRA
jgi:LysR family transcriptional regulator for bpeEF and oprC